MSINNQSYKIDSRNLLNIINLADKKVVLFGASKFGEKVNDYLKFNNIKVDFFCDNNCKKAGEKFQGVDIIDPKSLEKMKNDVIIIITSIYYENIYDQLNGLGIKNIFFVENYDENTSQYGQILRNKFKSQLKVAKNSIITNSSKFDFRQELIERIYVTIGEKCYIECNFIFEKQSGKINIGDRCSIGGGTNLISINEIDIGDDVIISYGCTIYDHNSHSIYWNERKNDVLNIINDFQNENNFIKNKDWKNVKTEKVKICDKVWIGFDVVILKGVTIGEGAVIGARSVVTKDVPPYTVVAGNPATIIKKIVEGE